MSKLLFIFKMSTLSKVYSSKEEINTDILRCWLEINLSNLKNNIQSFRNIITDKMDIICVTKANAYGFGTVTISNYLEHGLLLHKKIL